MSDLSGERIAVYQRFSDAHLLLAQAKYEIGHALAGLPNEDALTLAAQIKSELEDWISKGLEPSAKPVESKRSQKAKSELPTPTRAVLRFIKSRGDTGATRAEILDGTRGKFKTASANPDRLIVSTLSQMVAGTYAKVKFEGDRYRYIQADD